MNSVSIRKIIIESRKVSPLKCYYDAIRETNRLLQYYDGDVHEVNPAAEHMRTQCGEQVRSVELGLKQIVASLSAKTESIERGITESVGGVWPRDQIIPGPPRF